VSDFGLDDGRTNRYRVLNIAFGEEFCEIQYVETRDETPDVVTIRQQLIRTSRVEDEVMVLQALITDLIDSSEVMKRNPPESFTRALPQIDEEDDDGEDDGLP
jgi:hypothetical protein